MITYLFAQLAEQLVFPLGGPGLQLEDALLHELLELGGNKAFFVGEGLTSDPVIWHRR